MLAPFDPDTYDPYCYNTLSIYFNPLIENETSYEQVNRVIVNEIKFCSRDILYIEHKSLTDLTILTKMSEALKNNKYLKKIYFIKCIISNIKPIIEALTVNKNVEYLNLKYSVIYDSDEIFKCLSAHSKDITLKFFITIKQDMLIKLMFLDKC